MKGGDREMLEKSRPQIDAVEAVQFCLDRLFASQSKGLTDNVCEQLTYEELIGALLLAMDRLLDAE